MPNTKKNEINSSKNEQSSSSISLSYALKGQAHHKLAQQMRMISKAFISEHEKESTMSRILEQPPQVMDDSRIEFSDQSDSIHDQSFEQDTQKIGLDPKI